MREWHTKFTKSGFNNDFQYLMLTIFILKMFLTMYFKKHIVLV
jgi:hypothetical protein